MHRYCFTLDLKDNDQLIAEYEVHHQQLWPGVRQSFSDAGVENIEIYRAGVRLFMIFEVNKDFSFEKKNEIDRNNPDVQKWEALMSTYQQAGPGAMADEKWVMMKQIFRL
jgi:L-rhamnose mutarotase